MKKMTVTGLMLAGLLAWQGACASIILPQQWQALNIGINDYQGIQLQGAVNDAQWLSQALLRDSQRYCRGYAGHKPVTPCLSVQAETLLNHEARDFAVAGWWQQVLANEVAPRNILFSFSGLNLDQSAYRADALVLSVEPLRSISAAKLRQWLEQASQSGRVWLILDTCVNKKLLETLAAGDYHDNLFFIAPKTPADTAEISKHGKKYGVVSYLFGQVLAGTARTADGQQVNRMADIENYMRTQANALGRSLIFRGFSGKNADKTLD